MRRLVLPAGALREGELALPDELAHYARRVLRLPRGERLALSDGAGWRATGRYEGPTVWVESLEPAPPPRLELTLIQAVAKGDKMDAVVRQATELGATRIVPVITARSVARHEGRPERWRAIAEDAIRVSGRAHRPSVEAVMPIEAWLERPRAASALCFVLGGASLPSIWPASIELLIGPEGGLAPEEERRVEDAGFARVGLGEHTLRTETAGPAALAIVAYLAGGA